MNRSPEATVRAKRPAWRMPNLPRMAAALVLAAAIAYLAVLASSTDYSAYEARALRPPSSAAAHLSATGDTATGDTATGDTATGAVSTGRSPRVSVLPARNRRER